MWKAKQPVSVDGIEFDALLEQEEAYEAQVPEYPTEKGFSVSDNISLRPETLSMTLFLTDTPVTWRSRLGSGIDRVESVVKQLKDLYFARKIITVVTSNTVYENMALTNLSIRKTVEIGYAREIPVTFKKINVTESQIVVIPESYGKSGETGANAGEASTGSGSVEGESGVGDASSESSSSSSSGSSSDSDSGSVLYNAGKGIFY